MGDQLESAVKQLQPPWHGEFFPEVSSTQDVARSAAQQGAPSRSIFVADFQSAGRGRQGRSWVAKPGHALLLSLLLRRNGEAPKPWRSTALCSVALAEAIEQVVEGMQLAIKWPNDLLIDNKKVAGVLAESTWDGKEQTVIVGVGLNVTTPQEELDRIGATATSLTKATGKDVDRGHLLVAFAERIDDWLTHSEAQLQAAWHARLWGRGQRVQLADLGTHQDVVILGASFDGALRVRLHDGTERLTTTGELIL
jgi:BirA family transcriptional regulator, biotin operon repressor / biotin---[acetyl-CoA-carboxylase] ligase